MAVRTEKKCSPELGPCLQGESLIAYIRTESERHGFSLKTNYALSIANQLIANEKEIFKRVPSEVLGELLEGTQRNVEATLVARANEGSVRPDRAGLEAAPGAVESAPFLDWDRQEAALEAWARSRGCWKDDPLGWAESACGKMIAQGSESKVFRYTGNSVLKVLSCPFNPQETLDRIAINNFLLRSTRLDIVALGRNADGEFCFLLRQPFIKGKPVQAPTAVIDAFKDFEDTGDNEINPDYATERYLLGDLHDRNIVQDRCGNIHVIDCNLFLNTPAMGKGGKWEIPAVSYDPDAVQAIDELLDGLVPRIANAGRLCETVDAVRPGFSGQLLAEGRCEGAVELPLRGGTAEKYLFELNPDNPSQILYTKPSTVARLLAGDRRFTAQQAAQLADGRTVKTPSGSMRFSVHRGAVLPVEGKNARKIAVTTNIKLR